jgi:hypothetical protein
MLLDAEESKERKRGEEAGLGGVGNDGTVLGAGM